MSPQVPVKAACRELGRRRSRRASHVSIYMSNHRHRLEPFRRVLHHKQRRSASDLHLDERHQSDGDLPGEPGFAGRDRSLREPRPRGDRQRLCANERRGDGRRGQSRQHQPAGRDLRPLHGVERGRRRRRRPGGRRRQRRAWRRWRTCDGDFYRPAGQREPGRPSRTDCGRPGGNGGSGGTLGGSGGDGGPGGFGNIATANFDGGSIDVAGANNVGITAISQGGNGGSGAGGGFFYSGGGSGNNAGQAGTAQINTAAGASITTGGDNGVGIAAYSLGGGGGGGGGGFGLFYSGGGDGSTGGNGGPP